MLEIGKIYTNIWWRQSGFIEGKPQGRLGLWAKGDKREPWLDMGFLEPTDCCMVLEKESLGEGEHNMVKVLTGTTVGWINENAILFSHVELFN